MLGPRMLHDLGTASFSRGRDISLTAVAMAHAAVLFGVDSPHGLPHARFCSIRSRPKLWLHYNASIHRLQPRSDKPRTLPAPPPISFDAHHLIDFPIEYFLP